MDLNATFLMKVGQPSSGLGGHESGNKCVLKRFFITMLNRERKFVLAF
jgi:hypothetical protein